ncbi:MAG: hypothetical protein ABI583_12035 [Betaproteobacteria bacterium]
MTAHFMKLWALAASIVASFPFAAGATEAPSGPFQSVVRDGDSVVATLPARLKMQVTEGAGGRYRITQPGEAFRLQVGTTLVLAERHGSYRISAQVAPTAGIVVDATIDTRSMGGTLQSKQYFVPALAMPENAACLLVNVEVTTGMRRTDVEKHVGAALGRTSSYSTVANNLRGGRIAYSVAGCVLEVEYSSGAPAPLVSRSPGITEHLQAMDEAVIKTALRTELRSPLPKAKDSAK